MNKYLFTLFVRFFVAVSGFVFFIVSSKLFGAEGRGIIAFGTSLVSLIGFSLSFNLGRSFLFKAKKNEKLKNMYLPNFLAINYLLIIVGFLTSILFWFFSYRAREIIDFPLILAFAILLPYYLWSVNGNIFFSTLNQTPRQDLVILIQRITLITFALLAFMLNLKSFTTFFFAYAIILGCGALSEMIILGSPLRGFSQVFRIGDYISDSKYLHIDYLAFHSFPLILILLASLLFKLSQLGILNFMIQLINFVFILSIVAGIRVKTYVAEKGMAQYAESIKKLFLFTIALSVFLIAFIYLFLGTEFFHTYFSSFGDVASYFLIISLAVPGYIAYQFTYPILIEYNQINLSMKINLLILIILVSLAHPILKLYGLVGGVSLFALFYLLVLLAQFYIYRRLISMRILKKTHANVD
jgi:O-antigen/teichoic acid export membrane protein